MKTRMLLLLLFTSLVWVGCSDDEVVNQEIIISGSVCEPVFASEGGSYTVTFDAVGDWVAKTTRQRIHQRPKSIFVDDEWISVEPAMGGPGMQTVTIHASKSELEDWRSTQLVIGNATQVENVVNELSISTNTEVLEHFPKTRGVYKGTYVVDVSQASYSDLRGADSYVVGSTGVDLDIDVVVRSNPYDVTISKDASSWIYPPSALLPATRSAMKGMETNATPIDEGSENGFLRIYINTNETGVERTGTVTFSRMGVTHTITITQTADDPEREALMDIYESMGGDQWVNYYFWGSEKSLKYWHGVKMEHGVVTGLDLSMNNLKGELPQSISKLKHLKKLCLAGNKDGITGSLPESLGELADLEILELNYCSLTGEIPACLGKLKNLHVLSLSDNELSGELPEELGNIDLWDISLNDNNLTGGIPESFVNLTKCTTLLLNYNRLNGRASSAISAWLKGIDNLQIDPQQEGFSYQY
jgi:hypothetical protein